MLKKTITYENPFTGQPVSEDHYFHISKADLIEMEMEEHKDEYTAKDGRKLTGMQAKLQRIVDSEDGKAILIELKDMVRRSYGRKEGDRFIKSPDIWAEFSSSEAFSQLIFDLCTNATAAAEFINGVVPGDLERVAEEVRQRAEQATTTEIPAETKVDTALNGDGPSDDSTGPRLLTTAEMREMDANDLQEGLASGRYQYKLS